MRQQEIVRLTSASTLQEAHGIRSALEDNGIRCEVVGEYLTVNYGVGVPGMYPEIWVFRDDLDRASAILAGCKSNS
jgi:hypothetical protein